MRQLLAALSPDVGVLMGDLLAEGPIPVGRLRAELAEYAAQLSHHASTQEFIDLKTATVLCKACDELLGRTTEDTPPEHRRMIQAAARYLILDDDAEGDLASPIGFDDDAGRAPKRTVLGPQPLALHRPQDCA